MTTSNAIFLEAAGELVVRQVEQNYVPGASQALIKVEYSAINPADIRHAFMGLYGSVAGYEWVGTVIEKGAKSSFKDGQKLFGFTLPGTKRPQSVGAHQNYLLTDE